MGLFVLIFLVVSLQTGQILCADHVTTTGDVDLVQLIQRMSEFEKRENERENERLLWNQQMNDVLLQLTSVKNENKQLKSDINKLNERITDIENHNEELRNELVHIKSGLREDATITKDNASRQEKMDGHSKQSMDDRKFHVAKHPFRNEPDARRIRRAEMEVEVAFYATLSAHVEHLGSQQNIQFDHVVTNVGNAYNSHAGDFRAPVAGIYVFTTSLMAYGHQDTFYSIAKNGQQVGRMYIHGIDAQDASISETIVLQLNAGDDVAIRNKTPDGYLHVYSSFSGFLLQQNFTDVTGGVIVG